MIQSSIHKAHKRRVQEKCGKTLSRRKAGNDGYAWQFSWHEIYWLTSSLSRGSWNVRGITLNDPHLVKVFNIPLKDIFWMFKFLHYGFELLSMKSIIDLIIYKTFLLKLSIFVIVWYRFDSDLYWICNEISWFAKFWIYQLLSSNLIYNWHQLICQGHRITKICLCCQRIEKKQDCHKGILSSKFPVITYYVKFCGYLFHE